jgi:FtsP/CotA-like multicopper oxidase with cupredoxin domain
MKILFFIFVLTQSFLMVCQTKTFNLVSEMNLVFTLEDGSLTQYWGYGIVNGNGSHSMSLPGPLLEVNQGDTVVINFYNDSPEDHTIHLHGLDVDQANDGVPSTSFAIPSQQTTTYTFVAEHTGTFMYHCHVLTTLHLTMGMYGMIVVNNYPDSTKLFDGGPSFTNQYKFLTSDMDLSWNNNTLSIPPMYLFKSNYFMVNGLSGNDLYNNPNHIVTCNVGDSVLLRLGNIAYSKVVYIFPPELNARAYLSDGRVLPQSFSCDSLVVNAGERYTILLAPQEELTFQHQDILVNYYEARNNNLEHTNVIQLNTDLDINKVLNDELAIYPNPGTGIFNFKTLTINGNLQIYDITGQLIFSTIINQYTTSIDLTSFSKGIYLLKYNQQTIKIVKQ